jgi:polysaccharide biosynthesis transport protein
MHTYQAGSSPEALARDSGPTAEVFPLAVIAAAIWARRLIILVVALVAAIVGFVWASFRPPVYEALVTLMVADSKMRDGGQATTPAGYSPLLANRALAQRLIQELGLDTRYGYTPNGFLAGVRVDEVRNAPLVNVRVRLDDPELAAKAANRFAELAVELNRDLNQKDTSVARDRIKVQLDEAAARLESAREGMLAFRRGAQVELSKADITAVLEQRQELAGWMVSLATEKARLAQLERDLAAQPATLPGTRSAQADADLVTAINRASRDAAEAPAPSRPPDTLRQPEGALPPGTTSDMAIDARRRQDADRRQADREEDQARSRDEDRQRRADDERRADEVPTLPAGDGRTNPVRLLLEYQIATARSRVAALEQRRTELADVRRFDASRVQTLERLYRGEEELRRRDLDVRVAEKIYADLSDRYEQARLQVAARSAELQVVDPALPPRRPVSWRDASVALVCGLLGLVAATGVVSLAALVRSWRPA